MKTFTTRDIIGYLTAVAHASDEGAAWEDKRWYPADEFDQRDRAINGILKQLGPTVAQSPESGGAEPTAEIEIETDLAHALLELGLADLTLNAKGSAVVREYCAKVKAEHGKGAA